MERQFMYNIMKVRKITLGCKNNYCKNDKNYGCKNDNYWRQMNFLCVFVMLFPRY